MLPSPDRFAAPFRGAALGALLAAMPKAELHLHLDGAMRVETAIELARTRGINAPTDEAAMAAALMPGPRLSSQAELVRAFDLPIALLQDAEALERVTRELVEAKAADRVRYLEIRWAPGQHERRGLALVDGIAAVCRAAADAAARTGSIVRLIATLMRSQSPDKSVEVALTAARFLEDGLVAIDLAGPEEAYPDVQVHAGALAAARSAGLHVTVHAGEWGGAGQVRAALTVNPERIAHGPGAVDDTDLCATLRAKGITLDLCPTSNVQAGIVPAVAAHPLAILHRRGVPVTLSTDDPTVADLTLTEEYRRAVEEIGLSIDELWTIDRHALDVAFADEATLIPLRTEFDGWAASAGLGHAARA